MLTRQEYNELYKALEALTDAWEAYVKDIVVMGSATAALGIKVTEAKERLIQKLRDMKLRKAY